MADIDWDNVFDEAHAEPGASDDEVAKFVATALTPLSRDEIDEIRNSQSSPFSDDDSVFGDWTPCDPAAWTIPGRPFPNSYLSLLRWSNGAECRTGEKWFQFFPANAPEHGVRAIMLGYHVPEYLAGFVPFAFDGCGTFYLFDMRKPAVENEYPVILCHAGCLDLKESAKIADSFLAAVQGQWDWEDVN